MQIFFWIFILAGVPVPKQPELCVDEIELNHQYLKDGSPFMDQLIYWEIDPVTKKPHCLAWEMYEPNKPLGAILVVYPKDTVIRARVYRTGRTVTALSFKESWSHDDPERTNNLRLPDSLRKGIDRKPKVPAKPPEE